MMDSYPQWTSKSVSFHEFANLLQSYALFLGIAREIEIIWKINDLSKRKGGSFGNEAKI